MKNSIYLVIIFLFAFSCNKKVCKLSKDEFIERLYKKPIKGEYINPSLSSKKLHALLEKNNTKKYFLELVINKDRKYIEFLNSEKNTFLYHENLIEFINSFTVSVNNDTIHVSKFENKLNHFLKNKYFNNSYYVYWNTSLKDKDINKYYLAILGAHYSHINKNILTY